MTAALPFTGGPSIFAHAAFGDFVSFLLGYCYLAAYLIAASQIALTADSLLSIVAPGDGSSAAYAAIFLVLSVLFQGNSKLFFTSSLVLAVLVCFIVVVYCLLTLPFTANYAFQLFSFSTAMLPVPPSEPAIEAPFEFQGGLALFAASLPYGCWCYLGVEMLPVASEEAKAMDKQGPRSILSALGTLIALTILILFTVPGTPPGSAGLVTSLEPLVTSLLFNYQIPRESSLASFLTCVNLIGMLATLYTFVWSYTRQIYSLSRGGHLPHILSLTSIPFASFFARYPRLGPFQRFFFDQGIPHLAQWVGSLLVYILCVIFRSVLTDPSTVGMILNTSVLMSLFAYFIESCAFIVLRRKMKQLSRPFKSPLGLATGFISASLSLFTIVVNGIYQESMRRSLVLIAVCVGILIPYFFFFARKRLLLSPEKVFIKAQIGRKLKEKNVTKMSAKDTSMSMASENGVV
jgi:ethanolamine permease